MPAQLAQFLGQRLDRVARVLGKDAEVCLGAQRREVEGEGKGKI